MEYINEFHKQWIERTRRSIEEWKKHPPTREEVFEQQKRLDQQRAIRENNQQNNTRSVVSHLRLIHDHLII